MRLFSNEHVYEHPWENVSAANWKKYPNEITTHVIHVDYLSRHFDASQGILHTERLITCKQSLPAFILKMFGIDTVAYIYEKSEVNIKSKTLTLHGRNLTASNILTVEETCVYQPDITAPSMNRTLFTQTAQMTGFVWSSSIREKLEELCFDRFHVNSQRGLQALENVLQTLNANLDNMMDIVKHEAIETVEKFKDEISEIADSFTTHSHTKPHDSSKR